MNDTSRVKRRVCEEIQRAISAQWKADAPLADALQRHAAQCADCGRFLQGMTAQNALFATSAATSAREAPLVGTLTGAALRQFEQEQTRRPATPAWPWRTAALGWASAATLAGAAAVGVGLYGNRPAPPTAPIASTTKTKTSGGSAVAPGENKKPSSVVIATHSLPGIKAQRVKPPRLVSSNRVVMQQEGQDKRAGRVSGPVITALTFPSASPGAVKAKPVDDLERINADPAVAANGFRQDARASADDWAKLEERIRRTALQKDDFVTIPLPRLASLEDRAAIAAMTHEYQRQAAIVDARLQRSVTLAALGEPFRDFCARLSKETGIEIEADANVADDKATVLCEKRSLRDVMRQISGHFGFTWRREGDAGAYRYILTQELPSVLLEEEMRNHDRDAALIAIEEEMRPYRFLLKYSAAQARAEGIKEWLRVNELQRTGKAKPNEDYRFSLLENYFRHWGEINQYYDLNAEQRAALLRGDRLEFSPAPQEGEFPLSPERERNVRESNRDCSFLYFLNGENRGSSDGYVSLRDLGERERLRRMGIKSDNLARFPQSPDNISVADVQEARGTISLFIEQLEPGKAQLHGGSGWIYLKGSKRVNGVKSSSTIVSGSGLSHPLNRKRNWGMKNGDKAVLEGARIAELTVAPTAKVYPFPVSDGPSFPDVNYDAVRQADVLRQFHRLTGLDVIGDEFTRLFERSDLPEIKNENAFDALCRVCDALGVRWNVAAGEGKTPWLTFRRIAFFNDRITDVSHEKLSLWAAQRKERGYLDGEEIGEMSRLRDVVLDSSGLEKGVVGIYGLRGWGIARSPNLRPIWRLYGKLTAEQRRAVWSPEGLKVADLNPYQQQEFLKATGHMTMEAWQREAMLYQGVFRGQYVKPRETPESGGGEAREAGQNVSVNALPRQPDIEFIYQWSAKNGARGSQRFWR